MAPTAGLTMELPNALEIINESEANDGWETYAVNVIRAGGTTWQNLIHTGQF